MSVPQIDLSEPTSKCRLRCPNGHSFWIPQTESGFYCRSCKESYDELVDRKAGERVGQPDIDLVRSSPW